MVVYPIKNIWIFILNSKKTTPPPKKIHINIRDTSKYEAGTIKDFLNCDNKKHINVHVLQ